jgi:hypothetical protein
MFRSAASVRTSRRSSWTGSQVNEIDEEEF